MNIPVEVARAQGSHGIKGAAHGIKGAVHGAKGAVHGAKGGRPRLDLTEDERAERRRVQKQAHRLRKGIKPRPPRRPASWILTYLEIWGKLPGEPLTPDEFATREPFWNARVQKNSSRPKRERSPQEQRSARGHGSHQVGRNEPCPCGSGRKFKKCCGSV